MPSLQVISLFMCIIHSILSMLHSKWPANHHYLNALKLPVLMWPPKNCCMNHVVRWILHNLLNKMLRVALIAWIKLKKASKIIYRTFSAKILMCWKPFKICTISAVALQIERESANREGKNWLRILFPHRLSRPNNGVKIETSQNAKATKPNAGDNPQANGKRADKNDDARKFEVYFKFQSYFNSMHSHQTLAINRGENLKVKQKCTTPQILNNSVGIFMYIFFDS